MVFGALGHNIFLRILIRILYLDDKQCELVGHRPMLTDLRY